MPTLTQKAGTAMIIIFAVAFFAYHFAQTGLGVTSFAKAYFVPTPTPAPTPVAVTDTEKLGIQLGYTSSPSLWPTQVIIPTVHIDLPLTGSLEANGNWYVSETGANFATNTALPNELHGNTVLFGHDRSKLFADIHKLQFGDEIKVVTGGKIYIYKATWLEIVEPTNISVMDQTIDPILTLITCDGWLSEKRFVVRARFDRMVEANQNN